MAKLKRDERVCPFCGENIKAVAIRCRFCQSDVIPLVQPEPQPEIQSGSGASAESTPAPKPKPAAKSTPAPKPTLPPKPPPAPGSDTSVDESAAAASPSVSPLLAAWSLVRRELTLVLAILVLLAGAGVGVLWWHAEQGSSTVATGGSLVGDDARNEVLVSAADLTQRTLSYDYKTLANDMEVARARMTPSFRKEYDATMAQVRANTTKNKIVLQAVAVSSAIISATEHKAKVLVFVNQTTTAGVGKKANQQLSRNSLVVTLTRGDGDWAMSKLTALG
jgi:Mce-associated membrane protein